MFCNEKAQDVRKLWSMRLDQEAELKYGDELERCFDWILDLMIANNRVKIVNDYVELN